MMKVAFGSFQAANVTGNQTVSSITDVTSGESITAKLIFFWWGTQNAAGSSNNNFNFGWGFAHPDSGDEALVYVRQAGFPAAASTQAYYNSNCIYVAQTGTAGFASIVSSASGQFVINWGAAIVFSPIINYIAFGGDDFEASIQQIATPASTGTQTYTGFGHTSIGGFFMGVNRTDAVNAAYAGACNIGIGMFDDLLGQGGNSIYSLATGETTTNSSKWHLEDTAILMVGASEAEVYEAQVTAIREDEIDVNWLQTPGSGRHAWIISMYHPYAKVDVDNIQQPTSTGRQQIGVNVRKEPKVFFNMGGGTAASATPTAEAIIHSGAGSSSSLEKSLFVRTSDGTTNLDSRLSTTKVYSSINSSGTALSEADLESLDINCIFLNWSTADSIVREIMYMSMGDLPRVKNLLTLGSGF